MIVTVEDVLLFVIIFFNGFGCGIESNYIRYISLILYVVTYFMGLILSSSNIWITLSTNIFSSMILAVAIMSILWGFGYYVGNHWLRRTRG